MNLRESGGNFLGKRLQGSSGKAFVATFRFDTDLLDWVPFSGDSSGVAADVTVLNFPAVQAVSATDLDIRNLVFSTDKVDASGTVLGAGTNNIGDVDVLTMPAVTQGTTPWVVSAASLPLPSGAATLAEQQAQTTLLTGIDTDTTNLVLGQAQTNSNLGNIDTTLGIYQPYLANLAVIVLNSHLNNVAFARGVPSMGQFDDVSTIAVTENNVAALRINSSRALHVEVREGSAQVPLGTRLSQIAAAIYSFSGPTSLDAYQGVGGIVDQDLTDNGFSDLDGSPLHLTRRGSLWATLADTDGTPIAFGDITGPLATIAAAIHAEDAAHTTGQLGVFALARRNDSLAASPTSNDGDYSQFSVGSRGQMYVTHSNGTNFMPAGDDGARSIFTKVFDASGFFNVAQGIINVGGVGLAGVIPSDIALNFQKFAITGETFSLVAATANTQGTSRYITCDANGAIATYNNGSVKQSYRAVTSSFAIAASATDIATITGSASKTIKITKIRISSAQTTAGQIDVFLTKRSTANSGGTSAAPTVVPLDSANAAGTATVLQYTANPTTGSLVGNVDGKRKFISALTASSEGTEIEFGVTPAQPITLRGTSQVLAINLNGATVTGMTVVIMFEWTEE